MSNNADLILAMNIPSLLIEELEAVKFRKYYAAAMAVIHSEFNLRLNDDPRSLNILACQSHDSPSKGCVWCSAAKGEIGRVLALIDSEVDGYSESQKLIASVLAWM